MSYSSFEELAAAQGWSVEEQHAELSASYSDFHKEIYGCRPRRTDEMSVADLVAALEQLSRDAESDWYQAEREAERAWLDECHALETQGCTPADVQAMLANGAPDQETATRWAQQAHH
jgi:glutathione S-transferase